MNFINFKFVITTFFNEFPILLVALIQRKEMLSAGLIRLILGSFLFLVSLLILTKSMLDHIKYKKRKKKPL